MLEKKKKSKRCQETSGETCRISMERVATDILGELLKTARGNRHILVMSDYFTRWTEKFAKPNIEAQTVAKIVVDEIFAKLGVPRILHSDQGRQYESNLLQELCAYISRKQGRHLTNFKVMGW